MSEATLRTQVLIPLFRAMGYIEVRHSHGGILEQGKDITMWERTALGGRKNIAVVVKATRISGRASGAGSAAEVATQIRQSFGRAIEDGSGLRQEQVHECIVVSPHEITSEGRHSIDSLLEDPARRHVHFLHGHELWRLIQEHLGPRAALAQLAAAGQVLDNVSPHYRVIAHTSGANVAISVEPKYPEAITKEPLIMTGAFRFEDSDAGRAAREALARHVETGAPVTLSAEHIQSFSLPPFLHAVLGHEVAEISIAPLPSSVRARLHLEITSASGESLAIRDLEFVLAQAGTREATFSAERRPYRFSLVLDHLTKRAMFHVSTVLAGVNVSEALEAVRLRRLLASGGTVSIIDASTKLNLSTSGFISSTVVSHDDQLEALLADLVDVQEVTRTPLTVPTAEFDWNDLLDLRGVGAGLRLGIVQLSIADLSLTMGRRGVEALLNASEAASLRLAVVRDETARIFGTDVPLGAVARIVDGVAVGTEERSRLLAALEEDSDDFTVHLDCSGATATAAYIDRLSEEDRSRYRLMFPGIDSEAK